MNTWPPVVTWLINNWLFVIWLVVAIYFEINMSYQLGNSEGFKNLKPSIKGILYSYLSIGFVTLAAQYGSMSLVYLFWTGGGTFGTAIIDVAVHKKPIKSLRITFIFITVTGALLLIVLGEIG